MYCIQGGCSVKIVGISGSIVGSKTRIAVEHVLKYISNQYDSVEVELIDLKDYELVFSDGRSVDAYTGDTRFVLEKILDSDGILIGTPTFQASIPGTLKNLFDLLPMDAFRHKAIGILATAGSAKHYLVPEQQLKPILTYMLGWVLPKYVFIEEKDFTNYVLTNQNVLDRLTILADQLIQSTKQMKKNKIQPSSFSFKP